jgi:hypothetical protein
VATQTSVLDNAWTGLLGQTISHACCWWEHNGVVDRGGPSRATPIAAARAAALGPAPAMMPRRLTRARPYTGFHGNGGNPLGGQRLEGEDALGEPEHRCHDQERRANHTYTRASEAWFACPGILGGGKRAADAHDGVLKAV